MSSPLFYTCANQFLSEHDDMGLGLRQNPWTIWQDGFGQSVLFIFLPCVMLEATYPR